MPLVEILPGRSGLRIDLAYARSDNVTGRAIYARARCFLHPQAAALLDRAAELARPHGLSLKIFDAYRPPEAQWVLWNAFPDPEFVAVPSYTNHPITDGIALTFFPGARPLYVGLPPASITLFPLFGSSKDSSVRPLNAAGADG